MVASIKKSFLVMVSFVLIISVLMLAFQNCAKLSTNLPSVAETASLPAASFSPPSVQLQSNPPAITNLRNANVRFWARAEGTASIASVSCTLDSMAPVDCLQGYSGSNLNDGNHRLRIIATDNQGLSSSEVVVDWLIDSTPAAVSFIMPPADVVGATSINISFSAMDNGSGISNVVCSVDGSPANCVMTGNNGSLTLNNLTAGMKALRISATDRAQNVFNLDKNFEVRFSVPSVTLTATPASPNNLTSATFSFIGMSGGQVLTSFECSRDNGVTYTACNSGSVTYDAIPEGNHNFMVRSLNSMGVRSAPQPYSWMVDRSVPSIPNITAVAYSNQSTVNIIFSSADVNGGGVSSGIDPLAGFTCIFNGVTINNCQSPLTRTLLVNQSNTLQVTARDRAGNTSALGSRAIIHDDILPVIAFAATPAGSTTNTSASFTFAITETNQNARFCRLDNVNQTTCNSPEAFSNLAVGNHSFSVAATDLAGNAGTINYNWAITPPPPPPPPPPPVTPPMQAYVPNKFVAVNAANGGNGTSQSPWTLADAMRNAQPGDVVQVGPGIYSGNYKQNWREPTFNPTNSGTANAKIVFFAQYPAIHYYQQQLASTSQVRNNGTYVQDLGTGLACPDGSTNSGCGSSAIGCFNNNYIVWDGFYADEAYIAWAGDGGPVASNGSVGCEFRRNYIKMREQLTHRERLPDGSFMLARTNHRGILVEASHGTKIFDNIIEGEGYRIGEPDIRIYNGESAVVLYDSKNYEVANNIFRNLKIGFYPKGIHTGQPALVPGSFHHNIVEGCQEAHQFNAIASVGSTAAENEFFDIYQNIYINNELIFSIKPVGATDGPQQWRFVNNTVYNTLPNFGIAAFNAFSTEAGKQTVYKNNIFVGIRLAWEIYQGDYAASFGRADINYNRYFNVTSFYNIGNLSFAQWQALGNGSVNNYHPDLNSSIGDPIFVNPTGRNFKLQSSSPLLRGQTNSGYDVLNLQGEGANARINLGAFILPNQNEIIGIREP